MNEIIIANEFEYKFATTYLDRKAWYADNIRYCHNAFFL